MANDNFPGGRQPPKEYQFKKGQSGNPRGRPPGSKNMKTLTGEQLNQPFPILIDGRRLSYREALVYAVVRKALDGKLEHFMWLIENDPAQSPLYVEGASD